MTNDIIETIIFLIPGFICFEIFYLLSGADIKLHDKKYYLICVFISSLIYVVPALFSGVRYVQELDGHLIKINTILINYGLSFLISIMLALAVKSKLYPNHSVALHEPWSNFLVETSQDGASYVTVFTSDGCEIVGKLKQFTHKKNEPKEISIEDPYQIIRDENTKIPESTMDIGKSVLFTEGDIKRVIAYEIPKNDPNWLEKLLRIKL